MREKKGGKKKRKRKGGQKRKKELVGERREKKIAISSTELGTVFCFIFCVCVSTLFKLPGVALAL